MGVFACRAIKRGERILSEAPLVQWTLAPGDKTNAGLVALVNGLSPSDRSIYDSLSQNEHAHGAHKSIYGIWLTNALVATAGLNPRVPARVATWLLLVLTVMIVPLALAHI